MDLPANLPARGLDRRLRRLGQLSALARQSALTGATLTAAQYATLAVLAEQPGISEAALARSCLASPRAMAAVLAVLQERGLIRRTPHHWHPRVLEIRPTAAGTAALAEADHRLTRLAQRLESALTDAERYTLGVLLDRCFEALERPWPDEHP